MSESSRPSPAAIGPAPSVDLDSAFYWDSLRERKLRVQQCEDCERVRFPPMPTCPFCASRRKRVVIASGAGTVYSWIVVHRAFHPAFETDVPYIVATIDLDGGGRLAARLEAPGGVDFGQRVRAGYVDHDTWTELRFTTEGISN